MIVGVFWGYFAKSLSRRADLAFPVLRAYYFIINYDYMFPSVLGIFIDSNKQILGGFIPPHTTVL